MRYFFPFQARTKNDGGLINAFFLAGGIFWGWLLLPADGQS